MTSSTPTTQTRIKVQYKNDIRALLISQQQQQQLLSLQQVVTRLISLFPSLLLLLSPQDESLNLFFQRYQLKYVDDENDLVSIEHENEWLEAIRILSLKKPPQKLLSKHIKQTRSGTSDRHQTHGESQYDIQLMIIDRNSSLFPFINNIKTDIISSSTSSNSSSSNISNNVGSENENNGGQLSSSPSSLEQSWYFAHISYDETSEHPNNNNHNMNNYDSSSQSNHNNNNNISSNNDVSNLKSCVIKSMNPIDGATVYPGQKFEKQWLLKNTGNAPWPSQVQLSERPDRELNGCIVARVVPVAQPNESVVVSVTVQMPSLILHHDQSNYGGSSSRVLKCYFKLKTEPGVNGREFGATFWFEVNYCASEPSLSPAPFQQQQQQPQSVTLPTTMNNVPMTQPTMMSNYPQYQSNNIYYQQQQQQQQVPTMMNTTPTTTTTVSANPSYGMNHSLHDYRAMVMSNPVSQNMTTTTSHLSPVITSTASTATSTATSIDATQSLADSTPTMMNLSNNDQHSLIDTDSDSDTNSDDGEQSEFLNTCDDEQHQSLLSSSSSLSSSPVTVSSVTVPVSAAVSSPPRSMSPLFVADTTSSAIVQMHDDPSSMASLQNKKTTTVMSSSDISGRNSRSDSNSSSMSALSGRNTSPVQDNAKVETSYPPVSSLPPVFNQKQSDTDDASPLSVMIQNNLNLNYLNDAGNRPVVYRNEDDAQQLQERESLLQHKYSEEPNTEDTYVPLFKKPQSDNNASTSTSTAATVSANASSNSNFSNQANKWKPQLALLRRVNALNNVDDDEALRLLELYHGNLTDVITHVFK